MKKEQVKKKLTLDKFTVSNLAQKLDDAQKNKLAGGVKSIGETELSNCVTFFCSGPLSR